MISSVQQYQTENAGKEIKSKESVFGFLSQNSAPNIGLVLMEVSI